MLMRKLYIDDLAARFFYWWWWLFLCWRFSQQHWVGRTYLVGRWELFLICLRCWMLSTVGYHKSHFWLNEDDNYKVEYLFWSQHWDTGITQNLFFQHWGIFLHWSILKVTSRKEADIQFTIDNFMDPTLQKNMGLYLESMKKKSNKPTPQPPKHWADVKEESVSTLFAQLGACSWQ